METKIFQSRSATGNVAQNPSLQPFVLQERYDINRAFNTPHGFNAGGCEIKIQCELLHRDKHIRFPGGEVRWADIYTLPNGDALAVRQVAGTARSIGVLEFYTQRDFGFDVLMDFEPEEDGW